MNDQELNYIEKYFRNEMDAADKMAFEHRLSHDAAFKADVDAFQKAIKAIEQEGRRQIKEKLRLRQRPLPSNTVSISRWWYLSAAAVVVLLLGAVYWNRNMQNKKPVEKNPAQVILPDSSAASTMDKDSTTNLIENTQNSIKNTQNPIESTHNSIESTHNSIEKSKRQKGSKKPRSTKKTMQPMQPIKTITPEQLYVENFSPFQDSEFENSVRSTQLVKPSVSDRFLIPYFDEEYTAALDSFNRLPDIYKNNANTQFYYANALMAEGDTQTAIRILEKIQQDKYLKVKYQTETKWLSALCAIKNGDKQNAQKYLHELSVNGPETYREKAKKALSYNKLSQ